MSRNLDSIIWHLGSNFFWFETSFSNFLAFQWATFLHFFERRPISQSLIATLIYTLIHFLQLRLQCLPFSQEVIKMAVPLRVLVVLYFIITNSCTCAKTPLYVGALFPMTSEHNDGWTGGNGIQPAAQMAFNQVNSAGVLNDYELRMIWNDTKANIVFLVLNNF